MAVTAPIAPASRSGKRIKTSPIDAGLPDPRPVTDYRAVYEVFGGKSRITVTLTQPCIIRSPRWRFVSCDDGEGVFADSATATSNVTIVFDFPDIIDNTIGFIEVPYQDMQVQNFQGGFVRPGGQWFRAPK